VEITRAEDWEDDPAYGLQDSELVEATERRYVHRITRCRYAELWQEQGRPDIGYQIHCRCDVAWWDQPAWNSHVRFEQPRAPLAHPLDARERLALAVLAHAAPAPGRARSKRP
jgi:hypothetical protein